MKDYKKNYTVQHKLHLAETLFNEKKFLHAVQIYNSLILDYPDLFEAYFKLSEIYTLLGNSKAGLNLLNELIEKFPEEKVVRLGVGQYLFKNQMWEETIQVFSYLSPEEEPLVSFFTGYSHFMLNEFELSIISFENFIRLTNDSEFLYDAYAFLAKNKINLHDYNSAYKYLKAAEKLFTGSYELFLLYSIVFYYQGMDANAITAINKALKLNSKDADVHKWAGKIFMKAGEFLKAESHFQKYLSITDQHSTDVYFELGIACFNSKKLNEARSYLEFVLKHEPDNHKATEMIKSIDENSKSNLV